MSSSPAEFCARWGNGCGSVHCAAAGYVCLARGPLPCDVLFVGEAPGESEDVLGRPFVGPAGMLLDQIIERVVRPYPALRWAFTNVVGCVPRGEDGHKITQPDPDQIKACRPRLEEFMTLARPRLTVAVGEVAEKHLEPGYKHSVRLWPGTTLVKIVHPAFILRKTIAQRSLLVQQCVVILTQALRKLEVTRAPSIGQGQGEAAF